jgi:hypothetical protein
MGKENLIKRLKQHYLVEFLNIFLLPFSFCLSCFILNQSIGINSIFTMILNGLLLLEGSYFWFKVYQRIKNRNGSDLSKLRGIFSFLKIVNFALFILTIVVVIIYPFVSTLDKIGTFFFLILAILEHINYFEFQLMYDSENDKAYLKQFKRLKKSKLKTLLSRGK